MNELVKKLLDRQSSVEFETRTQSLEELKERLENGFVFITFTETHGGTELGITLDKDLTDISKADFETGVGIIVLSGACILNDQKVICKATIDLATCQGKGCLLI